MVIQRSWKILSDSASTAHNNTSSDVQQRSPAALQVNSSSDDSDCSNQTTHSMDTRLASPLKQTKQNEVEPPLEMMPTLTQNGIETSRKFVTTTEMAETMLQRIRQRYSGVHNMESGGNAESAMRALELLRISVQQAFDAEVNDIIKRYMNNYFKPAFGNIKENLGQHAVNEETLQKMSSCALLENAKGQYTNFVMRQQRPGCTATTLATEQQRMALKRPAKPHEYNNNKIFPNNLGFPVAAGKPMPCSSNTLTAQQQHQQLQQQQLQQQLQQQQQLLQLQQQQHLLRMPLMSGPLPTPVRRQIFWNTAQISTSTKFVLDVQANLAFGFNIDGKEMGGARLASKHPEIIRYLPDAEDREWLTVRGIIPPENRSSRFLFLIYDEVCRLQQTHELYRNKASIDLSMMLTFNVTETMIHKMKLFFVDLNIKSRGLITNSFILAGNAEQQHEQQQQQQEQQQQQQAQQQQQQSLQQQQPLQQQQQQQLPNNNNSHLRNALLQGTSTMPQLTPMPVTMLLPTVEDATTATTPKEQTVAIVTPCLQGTVVGSSTTNPLKPKMITTNISNASNTSSSSSSTLSSSHATLTALLNQGGTPAGLAPSTNKFRN